MRVCLLWLIEIYLILQRDSSCNFWRRFRTNDTKLSWKICRILETEYKFKYFEESLWPLLYVLFQNSWNILWRKFSCFEESYPLKKELRKICSISIISRNNSLTDRNFSSVLFVFSKEFFQKLHNVFYQMSQCNDIILCRDSFVNYLKAFFSRILLITFQRFQLIIHHNSE